MSFNWTHFLEVSKLLYHYAINNAKTSEKKEAAFRCTVSRAYYSAFGHSYEYAENHLSFIGTRSGEDHKNLRDWYKISGYPSVKRNLLQLWNMRKECDYEPFIYNADTKAKNSISTASQIIKDIDSILGKNP